MNRSKSARVGLFSTIPVEVVFAAGKVPVDINNLFVTHGDPGQLLRFADESGLPRNLCAWTRGLYAATVENNIDTVVVVPAGDCTNNVTMAELLERVGVRVVRFDYPQAQQGLRAQLTVSMARLAADLGTTVAAGEAIFERMRPLRESLAQVDALLAEGAIDPSLARLLLLESTDCAGNLELYHRRVARALEESQKEAHPGPRIAVFGIPTILSDLGETLGQLGAQVVVWETERDFAMVEPADSLVEQYLKYAYPYGLEARLERFLPLLAPRGVQGVVINAQAFCHHNLELKRVEAALSAVPHLVLESDAPGPVSPRDRIRLEGFLALASSRARRSLQPTGGAVSQEQALDQPGPLAMGLDLGSRFAKVTLSGAGCREQWTLDTIAFYRRFVALSQGRPTLDLPALLAELGRDPAEAVQVVATGYGRQVVSFANARTVPELEAHALGAVSQVTEDRFLLVDWGGQDTKVIEVVHGKLARFAMNDKCAAGSGRYVENMARLLGEPIVSLLSSSAEPVPLTNICATFGESEVIGHLVDGVPVARICAGVLAGVAERTAQLLAKLSDVDSLPLYLAGGLALSPALQELLSRATARAVAPLPEPRFNGSLGCCILARRDVDSR